MKTSKNKDTVLEFIQRRFGDTDANWCTGNCYYFSIILKDRFPKGKIMYDPIDNHFLFKYRGKVYDHTGLPKIEDELIPWDEYEAYDELDYKRVIKYCLK